ncbi:MAG: DinB family protein [Bryobacteraceae bacterium]|nr:DinB family protein [Bryobacteraceae bacterium]
MNRTAIVLTLAAAALVAGPLTRGERDRALSSLHASRKMFLDEVADLSGAQWNFKPGPDRWSIAECAEHIALSEDALFQLVSEKVLKSPPDPSKNTEAQRAKDAQVLDAIPDRAVRAQAPEFLRPAGKWSTREDLIAHFKQSRGRTIAFADNTDASLRDHFAPHPAVGELDAYQWILLISAHSERHVAQIREVKAAPNYPSR